MAATTFYLFATENYTQVATATGHGGDISFPATVRGWTEAMDCRHAPYTEQSITENCDVARHVRKKYILVNQDQLPDEHTAA